MSWQSAVVQKGWISIRLGASTCKAETAFCIEPGWISAQELPCAIPGSRHTEVPWVYTDARPLPPPEYPPHVVYVPQGLITSRTAFGSLHTRCLEKGLALKFVTVASTPNMQVLLVLVAGHQPLLPTSTWGRTSSHSGQEVTRPFQTQLVGASPHHHHHYHDPRQQQQQQPVSNAIATAAVARVAATPETSEVLQQAAGHDMTCLDILTSAASATTAVPVPVAAQARKATGPAPARKTQACFNGYFLLFKPERDLQPGQPYNIWWKRRNSERRNRDRDILIWREDLLQMGPRQPNGLPQSEQAVRLQGYWDGYSSQCGAAANPRLLHCSQVQSVMSDHAFLYVTRPWWPRPGDPQRTLEPSRSDQLDGFLRECNCGEMKCGKLRARQELKRLREEGVLYQLEVRRGSCLGNEHLGVFAGEPIQAGRFLFEYVGVWLLDGEAEAREKIYEPAGLHYLYDLSHRHEVLEKREVRRISVGVGGGSRGGGGGGVCKKRRANRAVAADDLHAEIPLVVDATNVGNVARFVNHRCEGANLVSVNVCMGGLDENHMTIMIRTLRDVQPGEELTLDYQAGLEPEEKERIRAEPEGLVPCRCGAASCLGFVFPHIDRAVRTWSGKARRNAVGTCRLPITMAIASRATTTPTTSTSSISDSGIGEGCTLAVEAADATATAAGSVASTGRPVPSSRACKISDQLDRVEMMKVDLGSSEQQLQHQQLHNQPNHEDTIEDDEVKGYCCVSAEAGNISLGGSGASQTLRDRPGSGSVGSDSDSGKAGGVIEGAVASCFLEVVSVVSPDPQSRNADCEDVIEVSCAAVVDARTYGHGPGRQLRYWGGGRRFGSEEG
ncbi:hypothetical protein VaNZ11_009508 [Volvox africanus]|uniref:Histone-lysine N-methyltransferase n=1 Tax=Volvox africanus TaxID=51714 RepID=A0ABQ5S7J5_9CHLO|nr:hypothetical protein VaNZ11_009508 [Volvox africanus]